MSHHENNKRIVKNTLALYFRQIITMFVALFTSRIILQTLGVTDFGINNVVGGVVAMLSFLTGSLSNTTQRFLNVEMGKNNHAELKNIFSNSLSLHLIFILLVVIIAQTLGLWFLQNKLVIPPERAEAAFWVFQFSVISFSVAVFFAPFDGAIKAHEKFSFYAKIALFDVFAKLVVVYLLVNLPYDKLIALSFMYMCVGVIGRVITYIYCHRNFEECRIKFSWAKDCVRRLLGYNVYKMVDSFSIILKTQGLNVILNLYYGPVLNAAQGIANTVYGALHSFSANALTATSPQITKSYAEKDKKRLWSLLTKSSYLYFYLSLILILPFILEADTVLYIWLGNYPEYTAVFVQLFLLDSLFIAIRNPIQIANNAVGKLRVNTIVFFTCRVLVLISAVIIGINKLSPAYIYISYLAFQFISISIFMVNTLKIQLGFSLRKYFAEVLLPITKTTLIVVSAPAVLHYFFSKSIISSVGIMVFTFIWSVIIVFYVGLNKNEKQMIVNKLPYSLRKYSIFSGRIYKKNKKANYEC